MPSLSEFLFAPWKTFMLILGGVQVPHGAPGGRVSTEICSSIVVGGEVLNTCRIFGYEMPSFIFVACLMILGLFTAASTSLLLRAARLASSIERAAQGVSKIGAPDPGAGLSVTQVSALRRILSEEDATSHAWAAFEETLLATDEHSPEFLATASVEDHFSRTSLIDAPLQEGIATAIPGILTGLGLLMTFVAILDGLSHVTVAQNMEVQGIAGLINGLSGKFASSIVAVSCAVAFVFIERAAVARPLVAHRRLVTALIPRFKRRTAEQLLGRIQKSIEELSSRLEARR